MATERRNDPAAARQRDEVRPPDVRQGRRLVVYEASEAPTQGSTVQHLEDTENDLSDLSYGSRDDRDTKELPKRG